MTMKKSSPFAPENTVPKLSIAAPVTFGMVVVAALLSGAFALSAIPPIDQGVSLSGQVVVETRVKPVQHQSGGTVAAIHVGEGETVEPGQTLVTFDTRAIDEEIAALTTQSEAAGRQLRFARQEAETVRGLFERQLAAQSKVLALDRQVAQIEKEVAALRARMAVAGQERAKASVTAPEGGKVLSLAIKGPGAVVEPGGTLLTIVPVSDRLVVEGHLSPDKIEDVREGMDARVWLSALGWTKRRAIPARLVRVSPDSLVEPRTGASFYLARIEFEVGRDEIERQTRLMPGMRTDILLMTGQRTLFETLLDPIMRNLGRAFRESA